jgi:leader peptidase (prepilin peptidase)/N-methyltransferase
VLVTLLVSITATDLTTYYILDRSTYIGLAVGVGLATLSGDLQMEHIWVDWNWEIQQIRPPWTPAWLATHQHWHGLAWSVTGALVGAILTLLVQYIAHWILDQPALGSGDVLLMAMIGSFLGWQPTLIAFALAPVLAVGWGILARVLGRQAVIPYGPFLAAGAIIVLFSWRWILMSEISLTGTATDDPRQVFALRRFLSDPYLLGIVLGGALLLMVILLGGLRWYRSGTVKA